MIEINASSFIDYGMPISSGFILEHMTSGAYHPVLGQIIPFRTSNLFAIPNQTTPLWQTISNLSLMAGSIIEPLMGEFGGLINVQQAFSPMAMTTQAFTGEGSHSMGSGIDISIKGFEADMSYLTKDFQRLAFRSSGMQLVYGSGCHIHINADPDYIRKVGNSTRMELPPVNTIDTISGITKTGSFTMRS